MRSKIGWMLAYLDDQCYTLFMDKTNGYSETGHSIRQQYLYDNEHTAILNGEEAIGADGEQIVVPLAVRENPMSHDFVWSTKQDAINSDWELAGGGNAVVLRVEAISEGEHPVHRPGPDGMEDHIIPEGIIPLYFVRF